MRRLNHAVLVDSVYGGGFGLVAGGAVLGVYSRVVAETVELGSRYRTSELEGIPERVATTAFVSAAVLAVVLAVVAATRRFRRNPPSWRSDPVIGWAVAVILLVGAAVFFGDEWWAKFTEIRTDVPYFPRMPTAMAAFGLVMVGLALIVAGSLAADYSAERTAAEWRRVVVRAGLVPAIFVSAVAIWAGEDSWNIDQTTAEHVASPPVPQWLGTERYRLPIPIGDLYEASTDERRIDVVSAGPGFVVSGHAGITAYDGVTGVERWHYRRTAQSGQPLRYRSGTLSSVGDDVIVAAWYGIGSMGFDAATGEVLWADSDFTRDRSSVDWFWDPVGDSTSTLANPTQLAGYDRRTGERRWRTDTADPACPAAEPNSWVHSLNDVGIGTILYRAGLCAKDGHSWWHVVAVDGETGAIIAATAIAHNPVPTGRSAEVNRLSVVRLGNSLALKWEDRATRKDRAIFVTGPGDLGSPTVHTEHVSPTDISPRGDLLVHEYVRQTGDTATYLTDPATGLRRFQLDSSRTPEDPEYRVFLDQEIVELSEWSDNQTFARPLRVWDPTDGLLIREETITDCGDARDQAEVKPVHGAVLVLCRTGEGADHRGKPLVIVGMSP